MAATEAVVLVSAAVSVSAVFAVFFRAEFGDVANFFTCPTSRVSSFHHNHHLPVPAE